MKKALNRLKASRYATGGAEAENPNFVEVVRQLLHEPVATVPSPPQRAPSTDEPAGAPVIQATSRERQHAAWLRAERQFETDNDSDAAEKLYDAQNKLFDDYLTLASSQGLEALDSEIVAMADNSAAAGAAYGVAASFAPAASTWTSDIDTSRSESAVVADHMVAGFTAGSGACAATVVLASVAPICGGVGAVVGEIIGFVRYRKAEQRVRTEQRKGADAYLRYKEDVQTAQAEERERIRLRLFHSLDSFAEKIDLQPLVVESFTYGESLVDYRGLSWDDTEATKTLNERLNATLPEAFFVTERLILHNGTDPKWTDEIPETERRLALWIGKIRDAEEVLIGDLVAELAPKETLRTLTGRWPVEGIMMRGPLSNSAVVDEVELERLMTEAKDTLKQKPSKSSGRSAAGGSNAAVVVVGAAAALGLLLMLRR
jgi:hypothetical protein